ncbi:MAG: site-specific DNA-methyltransferase [Bacteroidetes bacterium]|nr:site-specific DNA-methyltransferase [Bacteroidota bacterium]
MAETFVRNKKSKKTGQLSFGADLLFQQPDTLRQEFPSLFYKPNDGELWLGECIEWLKMLHDNSADLVFADPPYNINKADWDKFETHEKYLEWSLQWIEQAARVLKPTGTLFVCGFSEIIADFVSPCLKYFKSVRWIIWHYKNKANLGNDWGRSHESILHFRKSGEFKVNVDEVRIPYNQHTLKYPSHSQAQTSQYGNGKKREQLWEPNPNGAKPKDVIEIPTTCNGMHEKTPHPTQKPEELLRKLILSSTQPGDLVIDPFMGSGTTAVCAQQLQRKWKGCDISGEYLGWAKERLELVEKRSINDWIKFDYENTKRRNSIR